MATVNGCKRIEMATPEQRERLTTELTLADHAEIWAHKNNVPIPNDRGSVEWQEMYEQWHSYAFKDFPDDLEGF